MAQTTKIALIQMRCGPEPEKNFSRAVEFIREAAEKGARIVCLPELFRSQYFCQTEDHKNFDLAEEVPGKSTTALGLAGIRVRKRSSVKRSSQRGKPFNAATP